MDVLVKEAEALSLPCFDLIPAEKGDPIVAHWGGRRSDLSEEFPEFVTAYKSRRHVLSVEGELFDKLGLQGRGPFAFMIDTTVEDSEQPQAVPVSSASLSAVSFEDTIPLTAKPAISIPPFDAVLLYGGASVQEWLAAQGLQRWQYDEAHNNARDSYRDFFNPLLPLTFENPPFARIGGWHVSWPEDYFYTPREMRLMLWTFQDAEPWYELFLSPMRNYVSKTRIT